MTDRLEDFIQDNNLCDPEDTEALLTLADMARELIDEKQYSQINKLITYTIENRFYEAFHWVLQILQEELEQGSSSGLSDFVCDLGGMIDHYGTFIEELQVDFSSASTDVEMIPDENGEFESFFHILTYKTRYPNIYLVSAENFDTKDNDFIRYKLFFTRG